MLSLRFITLIFLFSCASLTAPSEYVPSFNKAKTYPYGSYIELETKGKLKILGEFIGISENNIFIRKGDTIYFLPIGDIKGAVVISNRPDNFSMAFISLFTLLGTFSTPFTHGFFLIFTAPGWVLSGILSGVIIVNEPVIKIKKLDDLNKVIYFSRYPQGIPEEIKQKSIKLTNQ
ncbi:MAG: hypothetical protein ACO2O6_03405 [Candidatus Hydrothermia bacterium]|jgi:hypothetical protein